MYVLIFVLNCAILIEQFIYTNYGMVTTMNNFYNLTHHNGESILRTAQNAGAFSIQHFIWLGIGALLICLALFLTKKFNLKHQTVYNIMAGIAIVSEFFEIMLNMLWVRGADGEILGDGSMALAPGGLPFHLCTIQIFFILIIAFVKNEKIRQPLRYFMCPTMLLGGAVATLIPSIPHLGFTADSISGYITTYKFFIYHFAIVFFAIYMIREGLVNIKFKDYLRNFAIFGALTVVAFWVNGALSYADPNFFFLTRPPMPGLPILNLDNGWYAYFATLVIIAVVAMSLVQLPIVFYYRHKEKKQ